MVYSPLKVKDFGHLINRNYWRLSALFRELLPLWCLLIIKMKALFGHDTTQVGCFASKALTILINLDTMSVECLHHCEIESFSHDLA